MDYSSYRPWLRDEFTFRCVYCLKREQWGLVTGEFNLDHFQPQAHAPGLATDYDNLLYACVRCNNTKSDQRVPNPTTTLIAEKQVHILPDASLEALTSEAERLILKLDLNSPRAKEWRLIWIRNVELAEEHDREQYLRLMGFPDDLPDLSRRRPPGGNTRPEGISKSWFAKKQRGELSETY